MTTGTADPSSAAPVTAPPPKNSFQRIAGVLFAPADTFRDIARKPDILVPLILIVLVSYVGSFVVMPKMDWDAVTAQQAEQVKKQNPNASDADIARMGKFAKAIGTTMGYVMPALFIVWYVIVAGVLLLVFRLMGGEGTFKQAFSTTLYSWMPMVVGGIVGVIVLALRPGLIDPTTMATLVKSNPAFLVDPKAQTVLFSLLSSFDIFTIWMIALLSIGFSEVARVSKAKSAAIVVTLWIVLILIKVGFAALGAGMRA
jgi:hypothetical protein